jgi:hypothetical protein
MTTSPREPVIAEAGLLPTVAGAWDRFWFSPTDPTTVCLMRVFMGVVLLYVHISYSFDLMSFVNPDRAWLNDAAAYNQRHERSIPGPPMDWTSGPTELAHGHYSWSIFFHLHEEWLIWTVHFSIVAVTLLFTLGLWTRVTTVLTWVGTMSYIQRSLTTVFGMDTMLIVGLTYMMIAPGGAVLSLDRWLAVRRARRRDPGASVPIQPSVPANLATRLFQIHFCFIYGTSGFSKLLGPAWWNGTALWICLANYTFAPMEFKPYLWFLRFLCQHRLLWELFFTGQAVFTLVMEIGLPFLVWNRNLRPVMVAGAVMLHLGIGMLMGLVCFSMMMMVLLGSFVPPEVLCRQLERLRRFESRSLPDAVRRLLSNGTRTEPLAVAGPR